MTEHCIITRGVIFELLTVEYLSFHASKYTRYKVQHNNTQNNISDVVYSVLQYSIDGISHWVVIYIVSTECWSQPNETRASFATHVYEYNWFVIQDNCFHVPVSR